MPSPHDVAEEGEGIVIKERDKADDLSKEAKDGDIVKPDAPSGLVGIFTGKTVVLTWGEVEGQGVESYRVYRIENDGYEMLGETVVPAFIDEEIKLKSRYRYKILSVGKADSDFSNGSEIETEENQ